MKKLNLLKTLLPALVMLFGSMSAWGQIASWDAPNNVSAWLETLAATNYDANVAVTQLVRGSGFGSANNAAGYSFGGSGADQATQTNAITNNDYFTMTIKANEGYKMSITGIPTWFTRKSGTGTMAIYVQYDLNGGGFADAGSINVTSSSSGGSATPLTFLSEAQTALSDLPSTTTVTLRFVVVSSASANVYMITGNAANNTNRFAIAGTVTADTSPCDPAGLAFSIATVNQPFSAGAYTQTATSNSGGDITYSSSDETVATVDAAGAVTFLKAGQTVISAEQAADGDYCEDEASYTLNIAYTVTSSVNESSLGSISQTGQVITATPAGACVVYASPAYTVTVGSATVSQEDNVFTVTPSSDCNVQINFLTDPGHTVTLYNEGALLGSDSGCSIALPTPTSGCEFGGWEFAGWTTANSVSGIITPEFVANPYTPTGDINLYAVYSKVTKSSAPSYAPSATSRQFVIAGKRGSTYNALPTNIPSAGGTKSGTDVTVTTEGSNVYVSTNDAVGYEWTIVEEDASGFTISNGTNYLTGTTANNTNLSLAAPKFYWTISAGTGGTYRVNSFDTRALVYRYGSATNVQNIFGNYAISNINGTEYYDIELLPIGDASITTYSTDPICPPILDSFTLKWTDAVVTPPAGSSDGTIAISTLNTDQTDCMEVYFGLNSAYSTDDYEVYLEGGSVALTRLGTGQDMKGKPSAYICFGNISGWTGTLTVKNLSGDVVETYGVTVGNSVTTGVNEAGKDKPLQTVQCYGATGVQLDCNQTQGFIIKRKVYTDGSTDVVKELR